MPGLDARPCLYTVRLALSLEMVRHSIGLASPNPNDEGMRAHSAKGLTRAVGLVDGAL